MKRFYLIPIILLIVLPSTAQKIETNSKTQRVQGKNIPGFSVRIAHDKFEEVQDFWFERLKENGKLRKRRNYYQADEVNFSSLSVVNLTLFTRLNTKDSIVTVWAGANNKDLAEYDQEPVNKEVDAFLRQFARDFYRDRMQKKIEESERAVTFTSKKHQRLLQDAKNLALQLSDIEVEQKRLEETLEKIKLEHAVLLQKIEDNKSDTEATYQDLEMIKKVLEDYKSQLKKME